MIARNSAFNLLGQVLPFLAAVVSMPVLIWGLGTERFGILTIAWMVIGYFSLFDLGLGRALTQLVAEAKSRASGQAPPVAWTALALMVVLGAAGGAAVAIAAHPLVHSVLRIPEHLRAETLASFYIMAAGIPLVVVMAGLAGILAAFHRFGTINAIRAPLAAFTFVGPLAVLPFSQSLVWVVTVLVIGRLIAFVAHVLVCRPLLPPFSALASRQKRGDVRSLFRFGAWMTVSNVVSPILQYMDRFLIGAVVSVAAVAYYTTPYEVVTRLLVIPGAVIAVLFPAFAETYRLDRARTVSLFVRCIKYIALALFPIILGTVAFAREGLLLWLGIEFADQSTRVLQLLAIGVFLNGLAQVAFALVQGIGRPDLTAKLHLLELTLYVPILWWAVSHHGILGAAWAWVGRVTLDWAMLFVACRLQYHEHAARLARAQGGLLLATLGLSIPLLFGGLPGRTLAAAAVLATFAALAWIVVLADEERAVIRNRMRVG